jgi:hypothetical protein
MEFSGFDWDSKRPPAYQDGMLIRPISARYMHEKEITAYEKQNPDLQQ